MPRGNYNVKSWPTKFGVTISSMRLADYTDRITDNEKTFPIGRGSELVRRLKEYSFQVFTDCYQANDWRVLDREDYITRRNLQGDAIKLCELLLPCIQLAQKEFHLEVRRMLYWGAMVIDVRDKIKAWEESDNKRYAKFL